MALKTDKVNLEIVIKSDKARAELAQLDVEAKNIRRQMKYMSQDSAEYITKMEQLRKVESRMAELKREIGLTGLTMRELRQEAKSLGIALNNLDPRSPKYRELRAELDKVNARMAELKGKSVQAGFSFGKMADGFNRYMGVVAALSASLIGVVLSMRKMVDAFDEYEQKVANLGALTGLAGADLEWLSDKAKELSVSTTDSGVKITKSADDIVDAYTKMGSARPELLANKEALAAVTEQALILSEAGQMDLDTSISAVSASMNQFNLDAKESSRIINVLAAGSLAGSAEVDSLTGSLKNVGTVANSSNMSLEQTVAALEVLAEKQYKGEEAGTKLRGALLKLKEAGVGYQSGQFNLQDALEETNKKMASLGSEAEKDALRQKLFGAENVTVGTILLDNIDKYNELTAAVTGTNVATEQAQKNTSTHKAELAQAKNQAKLMSIEIGEKLAPVLTFSTNVTVKFIRALFEIPNVVRNNEAAFIALGIALLAYNAHKITAMALKVKEFVLLRTGIALRAKEAVQYQYLLYQEKLAVIQKANLASGMGKLQGVTQKLFAVFKMNPFGAIVIAIGAVIGVVYALQSAFSKVSASQKAFNEANKLAGEYAAKEKSNLIELASVIFSTKKGTADRAKAINELNKSYGNYLPNLLAENATQKEILASLIEINKQIELEARLQAYKEKQTEAMKELIELESAYKAQKKVVDEGSLVGNLYNNRKIELQILNADVERQRKVVNDMTAEVTKLRMEYSKSTKGSGETGTGTGKPEPKEGDYMEQDGKVFVFKNGKWEVLKSDTPPDNGTEQKNIKTAYEKLNEEIAKYEALLKDQILLKDPAQNNTLAHLESLKQEKADVETLVELYNAMSEIRGTDPVAIKNREQIKGNKEEKPLKERTSWEDLNAQWEEAEKLIEDVQESSKALMQKTQKDLVDIGIKATDTLFAYQERKVNRRYAKERAAIQKLYDSKLITEDAYNKKIEALEKKKRLSQAKIEKKKETFKRAVQIGEITATAIKEAAKVKMQASVLAANPATIAFAPMALAQIPIIAGVAALQAGLIAAQPMPSVEEYAKGKYDVKGKSGRMYNTNFVGLPSTGIYKTPTLGIFSEHGDELVIDNPTLRKLQRNTPEVIRHIYRTAGKIPEFAEGKYPEGKGDPVPTAGAETQQPSTEDSVMLLRAILSELKNTINIKDLYDKLQEVEDNKSYINDNFTSK